MEPGARCWITEFRSKLDKRAWRDDSLGIGAGTGMKSSE